MIKLINVGCHGQMGRWVDEMAAKAADIEVVAGVDLYPNADAVPYPVYPSIDQCQQAADVVVDFSRPEALQGLIQWCIEKKCGLVVATTGLTDAHYAALEDAGKQIPVFQAANMSLGINLTIQLIQRAAAFLGEDFDVEIIETHHNRKVDAPSGTALALADAITTQYETEKEYTYGRHTRTQRRTSKEIGIHAVRGGTVVGEHRVLFLGEDEVLEIKHTAQSRQVFANGALRAARFVAGRAPGRYTMADLLQEI